MTPDSRDEGQVDWGSAATAHGRWLYVFGTRLTGRQYEFGRELYVARVPAADPGHRKGWRFWDGQAWQSDVASAKPVLPSEGGVSQTLSVDHVGGRFVAVSKLNGDIANFVYKWTAPEAWGPWRPVKEVKAPGGLDSGSYEYAPLAHPEVSLASGRLLVSISRNTSDFQRLVDDPEVGRPSSVELPRLSGESRPPFGGDGMWVRDHSPGVSRERAGSAVGQPRSRTGERSLAHRSAGAPECDTAPETGAVSSGGG